MSSSKELFFITSNENKLAEVRAILGATVPLSSHSLDLAEIQGSIEDISRDKSRRAAELTQRPVLVEDTALCFTSLKGLPGPYIKWFLEALGPEGLSQLLVAHEDKSAQAVCTFAYCEPGKDPILFQGMTTGKIVPPRGVRHFGWDPCFEYQGKTYAEMDKADKNAISHRYKALVALKEWLESDEAQ